jgi:succinyl-diaminopimelate desuccinylase
MASDPTEVLFKTIDARCDELVELTRELIRFPTVNPPGEARGPCVSRMSTW